jgi:hypothetical protein
MLTILVVMPVPLIPDHISWDLAGCGFLKKLFDGI